ncbi:MAG: GNAT family N-acetyltransferase [Acidobacteriota bacterium]
MIEIRPLHPSESRAARRVMAEVCNEIWQFHQTAEEMEEEFEAMDEFIDINELETYYYDNGGIFLAIVDDDEVVGTGAIKRLSEDICELKRMWILKAYRAQGWGKQIADALLQFAEAAGYERIWLEVYDPPVQQRAVEFYERLGFREIPPYRESPAKLYMEKLL